jgi:hypothetical protein
MGYDLHITRREHWSDEGAAISAEEWLEYVRSDPELQITGENGPFFADWSGCSKNPEPWLDWLDGDVFTKNPDRALVEKMLSIAQKLNARVQGDDGELYTDSSEVPDPDEAPPVSSALKLRPIASDSSVCLPAHRMGKCQFILLHGILLRGIPFALVFAIIFHIREHGWVLPRTVGEIGTIAYLLIAGSLVFGIVSGVSAWRKLPR